MKRLTKPSERAELVVQTRVASTIAALQAWEQGRDEGLVEERQRNVVVERDAARRRLDGERLIFSLRSDSEGMMEVVPGPGIDPTEALTTAVRAFGEAQAEATRQLARQRALPGAKAKRAKAKKATEAGLPEVVRLVKAREPEKVIAADLRISPRQVTRMKKLARQRGLLP